MDAVRLASAFLFFQSAILLNEFPGKTYLHH